MEGEGVGEERFWTKVGGKLEGEAERNSEIFVSN